MSRLPETDQSLRRWLRTQQRTADRVAGSSAYSRSGGSVTAVNEVTYEGLLKVLGTLQVDGVAQSADFDGDLATRDPGTTGWSMDATTVAVGDLLLRPGSIGNDALSDPVEDGAIGYSVTNFAVPASYAAVATRTIAVPSGFTRAAVLGIGSVGAWNGTATGGYLYARTMINGTGGASLPNYAGPSSYATVTVSAIRTLTDITAPEIEVSIACYADGGGWPAASFNIANIDVIALLRR